MIRSLLISSAIILAGSITTATAAPCANATYTKVMPEHKGIEFGMSSREALSAAKKLYQGKARVNKDSEGNVTVHFHGAHQAVFDQVMFISTNNVITAMAWSYSNGFQRRLGGPSDAFMAVLKKIKDTVGGADDNDKLEKGFSFTWNTKEGLKLTVIGVDPFTVISRFECKTLEDAEKAKVRNNTNMGF